MSNIIIIAGGGKFGEIAVLFARKKNFSAILIDKDSNCYASKFIDEKLDISNFKDLNVDFFKAKKIYFLNTDISIILELIEKLNPYYVIPVIPIHLLAEIIKLYFSKRYVELISDDTSTENFFVKAEKNIILNYIKEKAVIYLSYAKINEICPDYCSGPLKYCPNFKREKPISISSYLKNYFEAKEVIKIINSDFIKIIILAESYQLMPGLGGLKGKDIKMIIETLNKSINSLLKVRFNCIIATTCNCHGVINFFESNH